MHQISTGFLSSISGGYYSSRWRQQAAVGALVSPVRDNPHDLLSADDAHDETTACCNLNCRQPATPKNGDYNAHGQRYSWGTWWDDMH